MGTVILRIGIIILGVFLLSVTFSNYVRGKLREKATFLWGILAIAMILSPSTTSVLTTESPSACPT